MDPTVAVASLDADLHYQTWSVVDYQALLTCGATPFSRLVATTTRWAWVFHGAVDKLRHGLDAVEFLLHRLLSCCRG